jgi:Tol biopolymer transport system component
LTAAALWAAPADGTVPGPNGRIAYESTRDGDSEIFTINPDGTGETQLTSNSVTDNQPAWSPDGTKIAFASDEGGLGDFEIYVMDADGSNVVNVTNAHDSSDSDPTWSPDGTQIAYVSNFDGTPDIWKINVGGTGAVNLTSDEGSFDADPAWSPDGSKIAFSSDRGSALFDIYTMNADGWAQTNITQSPATWDSFPNWSPDGSQIAFQSSDGAGDFDIWRMTATGGSPVNLTNSPSADDQGATWSPDGTRIGFVSTQGDEGYDVWTMNSTDGGAQVNVTSNSVFEGGPDWGPFGAAPPPPPPPPPAGPDTSAPETTIDTTTPNGSSITFAFSSSEPNSVFQCQLDGGGFSSCFSPITYTGVGPGTHTFEVKAIDAAVNSDLTPATVSFSVATTGGGGGGDNVVITVLPSGSDRDADTIDDARDNCPNVPNTGQADLDGDRIGDACDESNGDLPPIVAETAVARVISGRIFIHYPKGKRPTPFATSSRARAAQVKGALPGFVPLRGAATIPMGSTIDAQEGRLSLTTAADLKRRTQRAQFYSGIFTVSQRRAKRPVTDLRLRTAGYRASCSGTSGNKARAAQRKSKRLGRLWGKGKGRFRTRGRFSAATVRGTTWLTEERCDGTRTQVDTGVVAVYDRGRRTTLRVKAGDSYLARATRAALHRLGLDR